MNAMPATIARPQIAIYRPVPKSRPMCVHCGTSAQSRPRRLCWQCYYRPGVRELHPSASKYSRHGVGNGNRMVVTLPDVPTIYLPGTPGKIEVLEQRAALGQNLWHPGDAVDMIERNAQ